jgi:hypothetical protein
MRGTYTNGGGLVTTIDTTFTYGAVVSATGFSIPVGDLESGNLASLQTLDSNRLLIQPGATTQLTEPPDQLIVTTTAPISTASSLTATVVNQVNSINLNQEISLYDYVANNWVVLDTRRASVGSDATVTVTGTSPTRFIQSGTRAMMLRLRHTRVGGTSVLRWASATNLVQWTIGS